MEVNKESDQKSDIQPHWMAAHARLKNEFSEDEKYHDLIGWLKCHLRKGKSECSYSLDYHQSSLKGCFRRSVLRCHAERNYKSFTHRLMTFNSILTKVARSK